LNILKAARLILLALIPFLSSFASADVAIPALTARVTDETATLTAEQRASLEQTLQNFEAKNGSQISVLIVPTTQPESIEQYSMRVVEQWKLGRVRVDDGALLIVAKNDRALRIEVGYGLEGALNDAISSRIINEVIVPRFKQDDFYGGLTAGVSWRSLRDRPGLSARTFRTDFGCRGCATFGAGAPSGFSCDRRRSRGGRMAVVRDGLNRNHRRCDCAGFYPIG
jgi:hypothetical protein